MNKQITDKQAIGATVNPPVHWETSAFDNLSTGRLFSLLKLRTDVFVVEQQCAYPEIDAQDNAKSTIHFMAILDDVVIAYARAFPTDDSAHRIGRVVVDAQYRRTGIARELMLRTERYISQNFPRADLVLSAQEPVLKFYESLGFVKESSVYMEDGIPHIDMRKRNY